MAQGPQQYNAAFLAELEKLNPPQRKAVEQIEGPVLVLAGPGTGKTHILASRIGRILLETDTSAHNILCLTFTDAGVRAMRQRLLQLIGPEAHRVHIYTFHSFCNSVIQDNLAYFGKQGLEPISELEQVELVRQILDNLDVDHPLKRGKTQVYFFEKHLRHLFQLLKTEGWSASHIHEAIDQYLVSLPEREEFIYKRKSGSYQKGDLKEAQIAKEEERMNLLRSAVDLFPVYEKQLSRAHRYDYADMILWVVEAFRENELLLRTYQEQYLYFLVDEYQDTNGSQNEILKLLTSFWEVPNLFIVGDDDQSIFEFQGARLKNLTDYYYRFEDHIKVVVLLDNYRSTQAILDASRELISHNERRMTHELKHLGVDKVLRAAHPDVKENTVRPSIIEYPNRLQEEAGILQEIRQFHQAGTPYSEIAILYARHSQVLSLQNLLEKEGIPYQTRRKINILDTPLIQQWRLLLTYFHLELQRPLSGDYLLFKILHFRCWQLAPRDLAQLSLWRASIPHEERPAWRQLLTQAKDWPVGIQDRERIQQVGRWLDESLGKAFEVSLPAFAERVLNGSGLLGQALLAEDRLWQVQVYKTFFSFVQAEAQRKPRLSLAQFLRVLDQMDANYISLPLQKDIELENGVHLVTAHSAKGLEFDCVFILDATKDYWEPNNRRGNTRFSLPDTLTLSGSSFEMEARRRLFYVAMTRAKKHLQISYAAENAKGKAQQRSLFIDELLSSEAIDLQERALSTEALLATEILHLQENQRPQIAVMEKSAIDALLNGFQLSVSSLNRYLNCPLSFYYEVILQAPQWQREAASYGLAMHNTLQYCFDAMMADSDRQFPAIGKILARFEVEMERLRAYFSPIEFDRRQEQGRRNLEQYVQEHLETWSRNSQTEVYFSQVEVEGVPIKGVIDRMDYLDDQRAAIVDYKTGSHSEAKLRRPTDAKPEGGNYWRQLLFYHLLFQERGGQSRRAVTGTISYLDRDKRGEQPEHTITFEKEDVIRFKEILGEVYQKIMAHDFYRGCGKPECNWCQFVKDHVSVPGYSDPAIEALDDKM